MLFFSQPSFSLGATYYMVQRGANSLVRGVICRREQMRAPLQSPRPSVTLSGADMLSSLNAMTNHSITELLGCCTSMVELQQIHSQMITTGLVRQPRLLPILLIPFSIIDSDPSHLNYARLILHQSENRSVFAFNIMMRVYSKSSEPEEALLLFTQLLRSQFQPDHFTFTFLVRSSTQLKSQKSGESIHCCAFLRGFDSDSHVQSALMHMYSAFGYASAAHQLFVEISQPDVVAWTAIVDAWAKAGELGCARNLFDQMPTRDVVAWNTMIAGYAQGGHSTTALSMFYEMQVAGVRATEATMVPVLLACAHLGALNQGKWIHVYIQKNNLRLNVILGTALLDMYAKCGDIMKAVDVFDMMIEKNVLTWTTLMVGLAMHGQGRKCLELFDTMTGDGVVPNEITYVAVLRACSVAGLVNKGKMHFDSMLKNYNIQPIPEHYGCMVDILGRSGNLEEALDFINRMPVAPHVGVWGALLNACRLYKRADMAEYALRKITELEFENDGAYVLLSNTYASSNKWEGVGGVRELMKQRGLRKIPGCSVIEVHGMVHEFFAGDKSHPRYMEIEMQLLEISNRLKLEGHEPDTHNVLFDIEQEEKENALCTHSERLALAFGFISLEEGMPIRIVKNLRACTDCHDVFKLISKVFNREIIVRDRNRFHHFRNGSCSCMDYW